MHTMIRIVDGEELRSVPAAHHAEEALGNVRSLIAGEDDFGDAVHIEIGNRRRHDDLPGVGEDRRARPGPLQHRSERLGRGAELAGREGRLPSRL